MANQGYRSQWPPPPEGAQWPPPGAGPAAGTGNPEKAYRWFVVYCAAMVALYVLLAALGAFLLAYDFDVTSEEQTELRIQGAALLVTGVGLTVVFAIGLFLPRRSWGWAYGLVLLILGMTSCCTWPATIPLLIQWLKPEMKGRFRTS